MKYINYDFISSDNLKYLHTYSYKGTDLSLLYNYILSPIAEYCLKFVPLNVAYFFRITIHLDLMCLHY